MSGETIAARRDGIGYSRKDASDLSGVAEGSIWSVENGKNPRGDAKDRYLIWLSAAEEKAAISTAEAMPWTKFNAKVMNAEPVLGDDDKPIPGEFTIADRGFGARHVFLEPTAEVCAVLDGWKPGRKFRVEGQAGSFVFRRLEVNLKTGSLNVECHGGTSKHNSFRTFAPEFIRG